MKATFATSTMFIVGFAALAFMHRHAELQLAAAIPWHCRGATMAAQHRTDCRAPRKLAARSASASETKPGKQLPPADTTSEDIAQVARAGGVIAMLAACSVYVDTLYGWLVRSSFCNAGLEFMFMIFLACSALWFLSPSYLAERVRQLLLPVALRMAALKKPRLASILFAASDFGGATTVILQAFIAASLVVNAIPSQVSLILPAIPANIVFLTGRKAVPAMGIWLSPIATLSGWGMRVLEVLAKGNTVMLLTAFVSVQLIRFLLGATAQRASMAKDGYSLSPSLRSISVDVIRTAVVGAVALKAIQAGVVAVNATQLHPTAMYSIAALSSPIFRNMCAARAFSLVFHKIKDNPLRGHVGGVFLSGRIKQFGLLTAEVELVDGETAYVPAWAILHLLRKDRDVCGHSLVPINALTSALKSAEGVMKPKKKNPLLVIPLIGAVILCYRWPAVGFAAYALGLTVYLCKMVVPRVLVLTIAGITLLSRGPVGVYIAGAVGAGLALASLPPVRSGSKPLLLCTNVDLAREEAEVTWRLHGPESSIKAAIEAAEAIPSSVKRRSPLADIVVAVISSLLCLLAARFWQSVEWIRMMTAHSAAATFVICAFGAAASIRLMRAGLIEKGARAVLPSWLSPICVLPSKVVHWFLAVNFRAAAAGAAMGLLLPQLSMLHNLLYIKVLKHQIHWFDGWLFKLSRVYLAGILTLQGARLLLRIMPRRPDSATVQAIISVGRAVVSGSASCLVLHTLPCIPGLAALKTSTALGIVGVFAVVGAVPPVLQDWAARAWFAVSGSLQVGKTVWASLDGADSNTAPIPGRLLKFDGRSAVLQMRSGQEHSVGAAELLQAGYAQVRRIEACIKISSRDQGKDASRAITRTICQHSAFLQRHPFKPRVAVEGNTEVKVTVFVDRRVSPDKAWHLRSELLTAAAASV